MLLVRLRQEIEHFLSVTSCDTLPLTRLEGLKELSRQLRQSKAAIRELLKECHGEQYSRPGGALCAAMVAREFLKDREIIYIEMS